MNERPKVVDANGPGDRLEDLVGYYLRRVSLLDMNEFIAHFADVKLRPIPFSVLCMIDEHPGSTGADICRMLGLQRANMVPILADLDEDHLIERRAETGDQRKQCLFLTEKGAANLAQWRARARAHESRLLSRLTAAERTSLRRILAKIWISDDR